MLYDLNSFVAYIHWLENEPLLIHWGTMEQATTLRGRSADYYRFVAERRTTPKIQFLGNFALKADARTHVFAIAKTLAPLIPVNVRQQKIKTTRPDGRRLKGPRYVKCPETGYIFASAADAARAMGIHVETIRRHILKGNGTVGGGYTFVRTHEPPSFRNGIDNPHTRRGAAKLP